MLLASTAIGAVVVLIMIAPYRMTRFTSFLNPSRTRATSGYPGGRGPVRPVQRRLVRGRLGAEPVKWGLLPDAHTDYIFAIIGEELGLVGSLLVLALFAVLAYAGIRIARRATDPFVRLASAAVTVWLVGQALINIGYVTGLLPVTGVPLPLISSGGTSLMLTLFALGHAGLLRPARAGRGRRAAGPGAEPDGPHAVAAGTGGAATEVGPGHPDPPASRAGDRSRPAWPGRRARRHRRCRPPAPTDAGPGEPPAVTSCSPAAGTAGHIEPGAGPRRRAPRGATRRVRITAPGHRAWAGGAAGARPAATTWR